MRFANWLSLNGHTPASFAKLRGWSRVRVGRYASGARVPDKTAMREIYLTTNGQVTPNDFYDLPEIPAGVEATSGQSSPVASSPGFSSLLSAPVGMGKHAPAGEFAAVGHGD